MSPTSLMLHDLRDWTAPLSSCALLARGRLHLSVNHPRLLESSDPGADCFAVTQYYEYTFGDGGPGAELPTPAARTS